jgi:hypothetical protein
MSSAQWEENKVSILLFMIAIWAMSALMVKFAASDTLIFNILMGIFVVVTAVMDHMTQITIIS